MILLLVIPFLIILPMWLKKQRYAMLLPTVGTFKKVKSGRVSIWRRELVAILRIAAILLLVLAAARPQLGYSEEKTVTEGVDIVLCVDVSGSMLAEDFTPNRLEVSKEVLKDFAKQMEGNRIGLVAFARVAFTQCPLTTDIQIVQQLVRQLSTDTITMDGTAIGDAIGTAVNKFVENEVQSRVIVLLTDGENNAGVDPILASKIAHDKGIKIYVIGIGTEEGAPIPMYDAYGRKTYQRYGRQVVRTRIDEDMLREIAQITRGRYFHADDASKLREIYGEIAQMETHQIETTEYTSYNELYGYFLIPGIILLFFEIFLFTGKNKRMV